MSIVMLAAVTLAEVQPAAVIETSSSRNVLAVHWNAAGVVSTPVTDARIREVLLSCPGGPVHYYAEYLESDRFPRDVASLALRHYIRRKYENRPIAAVIAIASPALEFAVRHRTELFPASPIVYLGVAELDAAIHDAGTGVTGVVSPEAFGPTLKLALRLHPATERVLVVARAPAAALPATLRPELAGLSRGVELTFSDEQSMADLLAAVKALPERSLILYIHHSPRSGQVVFPPEVVRLVAKASPVPLYSTAEAAIGDGAVGGAVYDTRALATRIGEMACRVLNGTRPQDIPLEHARVVPTFDWLQLQRWEISLSQLPKWANVLNREETAWEQYRWYIIGALALLILQGLMIAALVVQRARRRETEARNTAILRALPDMMFLQTADGVYVDYYAPDPGLLLVAPERFMGRHMRDVLPPDVAAKFEEHFARLTPGKEPTVIEYTLQMPDGPRYYEARVVPCTASEVLSVVRDITARKRAEAALSASEERYALATAAGGVGVWDWNLETGEVYVDPALKAILGFADGEIRNHSDDWTRLVHPDDRATVREHAQAHIDGRNQLYEVEHRMLHRDGSVRWFLARGSAVRRDGVAVRIIGTDTDITERKKSEQALHEAQTELTRLSRLTALGEFAASIAHEVSQPLTAIMMNANTCLRWLSDVPPDLTQVRTAVWDVIEASKRADEVIRRNRELFRHHTVQKAPVDVNAVIRDVAILAAAHLHRSQVTLTTALGPALPTIVADRLELQQVLLNLIVNAIDAMQGLAPGSRRIEIVSALADGGVQVSVRDHGVGLHGVDTARMFAPSYTTKMHGTGVGLSISRSIVEAHGGRLWAEANDDRGATFFFTVPVHSTAAAT